MWLNIDGFLQKKKRKKKEKIAHAIPVEETPRIVLEDDPYEVLSNILVKVNKRAQPPQERIEPWIFRWREWYTKPHLDLQQKA